MPNFSSFGLQMKPAITFYPFWRVKWTFPITFDFFIFSAVSRPNELKFGVKIVFSRNQKYIAILFICHIVELFRLENS